MYTYEEQRAGYGRDAALRQAEATDAQTLAQNVAAEQRKMDIEIEYLEKVHGIRMRLFDLDTSREVLELEANAASGANNEFFEPAFGSNPRPIRLPTQSPTQNRRVRQLPPDVGSAC